MPALPGGHEYWCGLRNCESSLPKSIGYATRSLVARKFGWYRNNVSAYVSSRFLCDRLTEAGFDRARIHVLPNLVADPLAGNPITIRRRAILWAMRGGSPRERCGHAAPRGRACPEIAFRLAGRVRENFPLPPLPANVTLLGHLEGEALAGFYRGARMIVTPSDCFETFRNVTAEALLYRRPVVVSRIGVLPEFVREQVDGRALEPGSAAELANRIGYLWDRPEPVPPNGAGRQGKGPGRVFARAVVSGVMAAFEQARTAPAPARGLWLVVE